MAGWLILLGCVGLFVYYAGLEIALWAILGLGILLLILNAFLHLFTWMSKILPSSSKPILRNGKCGTCGEVVWLNVGYEEHPEQLRHLSWRQAIPVEAVPRVTSEHCGGMIRAL